MGLTGGYLLRTVFQAVVTILVTTFLLFLALHALPGDPVRALFGFSAPPPDVYEAIRQQFHLDEPLWRQYLLFVTDLATGDLGESFPRNPLGRAGGTPIAPRLAAALAVSGRILLGTLVVMVSCGLAAAVVGAATRGRRFRTLVYGSAILGVSVPVLVLAFSFQAFVARRVALFPVISGISDWRGYVLPILSVALPASAYLTLVAQSQLRTTLRAPFVSVARANGISRRRVVAVHALRATLLDIVTFVGAHLPQLVAGVVIVEGVYQLPGVGGLMLDAIVMQDRALLLVVVVLLITGVVATSTLIDLLHATLDPRTAR